MANLSLTRVNQKLAQAKALLQQDESNLTEVHRQSLIEATGFHLLCAYQHYLRELAETYGLKNAASITSTVDLCKALDTAGKHPAEAEELRALKDGQSWLTDLHSFYDSLWRTPKPTVTQSQDDGLINLVDVDSAQLNPDLDLLTQWHGNFVALVKRQRETSAEF